MLSWLFDPLVYLFFSFSLTWNSGLKIIQLYSVESRQGHLIYCFYSNLDVSHFYRSV